MGINAPILIYTHSDYKDVWPLLFGQLKKYINKPKVYVLNNKSDLDIPNDYLTIIYDERNQYTERLKEGLSKISDEDETLLFMHEDMILFDTPKIDIINRYIDYIKNDIVDSVKLIYVSDVDITSDFDETLINNRYAKFSIQPTLINKKFFIKLINSTPPLNIWDFEINVSNEGRNFLCKLGGEKKRGLYHYDSIIFPYIATAIVKGKWNLNEYNTELNHLFYEYNIKLIRETI